MKLAEPALRLSCTVPLFAWILWFPNGLFAAPPTAGPSPKTQHKLVRFALPDRAGKAFRRMFITRLAGADQHAVGAILTEDTPGSLRWLITRWDTPEKPVVLEAQQTNWLFDRLSINEARTVVGAVATEAQRDALQATRWRVDAAREPLALPPGHPSGAVAVDVNRGGEIVGSGTANDEFGPGIIVWSAAGAPKLLPMPDRAQGSSAADMNDEGLIVGSALIYPGDASNRGTPESKAVAWRQGRPELLAEPQSLRGGSAAALACSNGGFIAGRIAKRDGGFLAVRWNPKGEPQVLATPVASTGEGVREAVARAVDDAGRCAGQIQLPDGKHRAVLWDADGSCRALDDLLDASGKGWTLQTASGIGTDFILAAGQDGSTPPNQQVPVLLRRIQP